MILSTYGYSPIQSVEGWDSKSLQESESFWVHESNRIKIAQAINDKYDSLQDASSLNS